MKEELKTLSDKLAEARDLKIQKLLFCSEHKFEREAQLVRDQLAIIEEVERQIRFVADGIRKPSEVNFKF